MKTEMNTMWHRILDWRIETGIVSSISAMIGVQQVEMGMVEKYGLQLGLFTITILLITKIIPEKEKAARNREDNLLKIILQKDEVQRTKDDTHNKEISDLNKQHNEAMGEATKQLLEAANSCRVGK